MAAPSYKGETATAQCPECGRFSQVPADRDMFGKRGHCRGPEGEDPCGQVEWDVWNGPVTTVNN